MPHIHTEPGQYDHTASTFLFRTDFDTPKLMLHFHKKLDSYMQFGGHVELNENPWQAVIHELREESGYDINQLQVLQPKQRLKSLGDAVIHPQPISHTTHPIGNDHFHTDSTYALITNEKPRHQPHEGESTDIQLFSRTELIGLPDNKIIQNVREIALYIFDNCLDEFELVPTSEFK